VNGEWVYRKGNMSWALTLVSLNRPSRRIMEGYCKAALGRLGERKPGRPALGGFN
jgi:hypothetical protein